MTLLDNHLLEETSPEAAVLVQQSFIRFNLRLYALTESLSRLVHCSPQGGGGRGLTKVAQHFSGRLRFRNAIRPVRDDRSFPSSLTGRALPFNGTPALKCWATFTQSLRDRRTYPNPCTGAYEQSPSLMRHARREPERHSSTTAIRRMRTKSGYCHHGMAEFSSLAS
jgi:hypothetical protein